MTNVNLNTTDEKHIDPQSTHNHQNPTTTATNQNPIVHPPAQRSELFTKIFYICALYTSFLVSGVFEEKLYKGSYLDSENKKLKFTHPVLAIFFNSFISLVISSIVLSMMYI
jgi:hypothetical protein